MLTEFIMSSYQCSWDNRASSESRDLTMDRLVIKNIDIWMVNVHTAIYCAILYITISSKLETINENVQYSVNTFVKHLFNFQKLKQCVIQRYRAI